MSFGTLRLRLRCHGVSFEDNTNSNDMTQNLNAEYELIKLDNDAHFYKKRGCRVNVAGKWMHINKSINWFHAIIQIWGDCEEIISEWNGIITIKYMDIDCDLSSNWLYERIFTSMLDQSNHIYCIKSQTLNDKYNLLMALSSLILHTVTPFRSV